MFYLILNKEALNEQKAHLLCVYALIVWAVLHLQAVVLVQSFLVIADTLDEHVLETAVEFRPQVLPPLHSRVGGIKYRNLIVHRYAAVLLFSK